MYLLKTQSLRGSHNGCLIVGIVDTVEEGDDAPRSLSNRFFDTKSPHFVEESSIAIGAKIRWQPIGEPVQPFELFFAGRRFWCALSSKDGHEPQYTV